MQQANLNAELRSPGTARLSEFRSGEAYRYDTRTPVRWILSHVMRYPWLPILALLFALANNVGFTGMKLLIGQAFDVLSVPGWTNADLLRVSLIMAVAAVAQGLGGILRNISFEFLAQKLERDARAELFESLLGKSQTFHSRMKTGDLMARATNDVHFLNLMFSPGLALIIDSGLTSIVPLVMVAFINPQLLLVPLLFMAALFVTVRHYNRTLNPLTDEQRERFGQMNGELADALEGIETVKSNLGELREIKRFSDNAGRLRDLYIKVAKVEGRFWPLLVFALAWGAGFFHALYLWKNGIISAGDAVGYMMLYDAFRFTTFISLFSFNLFQMGLSSAKRVLETINTRTRLDENPAGHSAKIAGSIEFKSVSFSFNEDDSSPVLRDISFSLKPGQTVAIVGRTGSGKTSLARLVTRVFDTSTGSILVDGIDVRDWHLESLRSQTALVEQDVFLFGKSIAENIAFGKPDASQAEIEEAAKAAQAHDFILDFSEGYATLVGERGVTLSGGQKQRIAIARAFIADPAILILDDSTSAVDSRTEDAIQTAMRKAGAGRTTLLITHRLSQIRAADHILLLEGGSLAAQGTHEQLLNSSDDYRRLFARV
ncbi:MAG: ABC transporter ATP-binding protein/permease [Spirochaetes bacterium]|nr:ABC transporter ATP-binding protein/permease [Spirochaetota bacterium]MBU0956764.1 ABC transporter ATP-binding protein/permease [Spirochaetota bacterium]